ncbi:CgeB family protein [Telmatospirillum siberiense]|uniref:Spore protein YkvP/CgeB glycosyl transferase-like domain-containing protein n=1 Tax=Telmatospirillum siberiense TaxID=382514 RepID=A0A2N3PVP3_9PROT|nr:glycosyltransferase [Telmatospirillum siberiense]PKU24457.1 hypothetical protein CWS72_11455 [Telmatospirillum siberiense]
MRVMYVGSLAPSATSRHRRLAIERLGHQVIDFDTDPYQSRGGRILSAIRVRTLVGRAIHALNRDLVAVAQHHHPDLIWFDKATYVWAKTVKWCRNNGLFTVHYNIDNPFGPRNDPGWRLLLEALPEYDLHLVQRDINLEDYRSAGARDVYMLRTAYEPTLHFPPPEGWSDTDRPHAVAFIGHPYDKRAQFLTDLWQRHEIPLKIWGAAWPALLSPDAKKALWMGNGVYDDLYRETIWRSRACLSFVTHSNCDDVAHKSFEIAACGGFLMAEDTPGHRAHFADGEEAVLFHSVDDCAEKLRAYLADETDRSRIATAGRKRCEQSGYGNDARIGKVIKYIIKNYNL